MYYFYNTEWQVWRINMSGLKMNFIVSLQFQKKRKNEIIYLKDVKIQDVQMNYSV